MKITKSREVIIEFERIQIVRKRAKAHLRNCQDCRSNADFVLLHEAATLFNSTTQLLFQFICDTGSHYQTEQNGAIYICLTSLLGNMRERARDNGRQIKLLEDSG